LLFTCLYFKIQANKGPLTMKFASNKPNLDSQQFSCLDKSQQSLVKDHTQ